MVQLQVLHTSVLVILVKYMLSHRLYKDRAACLHRIGAQWLAVYKQTPVSALTTQTSTQSHPLKFILCNCQHLLVPHPHTHRHFIHSRTYLMVSVTCCCLRIVAKPKLFTHSYHFNCLLAANCDQSWKFFDRNHVRSCLRWISFV